MIFTNARTLGATLIIFSMSVCQATADLIFEFSEAPGGVQLSWSGSVDFGIATPITENGNDEVWAFNSAGFELVGVFAVANSDKYNGTSVASGTNTISVAVRDFSPISVSGDLVLFRHMAGGIADFWLPEGYVSTSSLSGSGLTDDAASLAALGLTVGDSFSYTTTIGGATNTVSVSAVPEPNAILLTCVPFLFLVLHRRRKVAP